MSPPPLNTKTNPAVLEARLKPQEQAGELKSQQEEPLRGLFLMILALFCTEARRQHA